MTAPTESGPVGETASTCALFCADGQRGDFGRDGKPCKRCGDPAWKHWTQQPRGGQ